MAAKGNVAAAAALVIICNMYGCAPGANESQPSNPEPSPSGEYADQNESLSADIDEKSDSNDATYTLDEVSTTKDMLFIEHNGVCTALQGDYSFQERASKWTDADGEQCIPEKEEVNTPYNKSIGAKGTACLRQKA